MGKRDLLRAMGFSCLWCMRRFPKGVVFLGYTSGSMKYDPSSPQFLLPDPGGGEALRLVDLPKYMCAMGNFD